MRAHPLSRRTRSGAVGVAGRRLLILGTMIPLLVFYSLFLIFPMAYAFVMTFFDWNPIRPERIFVGLANYRYALMTDLLFWVCLRNTIYYTILAVPLGTIIALALAVLLNSLPRFSTLFRTIYFLPVVTSMIAAAIIWGWIYQPRFGLLNAILDTVYQALGINLGFPGWLNDPTLARPSLVIMSTWKGVGFTVVIFLAGLQGIPRHYYEAAQVDGAGPWQIFWYITIPLLRPTLIFVLVTGVIYSLQVFTPMFVMTQGGPVNSTRTIVYLLYDWAFDMFKFGYASALSFILFALILAITLVQLRVLTVRWEY
jgi:multiple sugar transport system permease protein